MKLMGRTGSSSMWWQNSHEEKGNRDQIGLGSGKAGKDPYRR